MGTDRDKKKKKRRQVSSSSDSRRSFSSSRSERHTKKSRKNRKSERKQERSKSSSEENTNQNKKVKTNPQSVTNQQQQGQQQFQPNFFMPMMGPGQMMKPYDPMFMGGQQGNIMGPMQTNFFKYNWGQQQMPYNPMLMQNMNLSMMDQKQSQPHAQQLLQKPMMPTLKQPLQPQQLQQQQVQQQQPLQQQQSTQQYQQLQNQNIKPLVQQAPKNPLDPENFSVFKNRYIYPIVSEYLTNTQLNSKLCDQENILALCKKAFRDLQKKLEQQGGDKMLISQIDEFLEQLRNEEVEELIRQDKKLQNSKNEFQKVFQGQEGKEQDYTGYQILNEIQKDKSLFQILGTNKIENIFVNLNPTVKSFVNNLNSITDEEDLYQESLNLTSLSQQKIKVE